MHRQRTRPPYPDPPGSGTRTNQIADARRQWQLSFDMTSRGIAFVNRDGERFERVNPAFAAIHGTHPSHLVGRPLVSADVSVGADYLQHAPLADRTGFARYETTHQRADGTLVTVEVELVSVGSGTPAADCVMFVRDLSDQRAREADARLAANLFTTAFQRAPIGKCLVDLQGRLLSVNAAACKLWERGEDELLSATFQELTHPEDLDADLALLNATLAGERDGYEMNKRYLTPSGRVIPARLCVALIRNDDGSPAHFVSQIVDLTDIHTANEQIRVLEERERIAGEVHDHTIQRLFATGLRLNSLASSAPAGPDADRLTTIIDELDAAIIELRHIIYGIPGS